MTNDDSKKADDEKVEPSVPERKKISFGGLKPLTAAQITALLINSDKSAGACACACACGGPCY